MDHAVVEPDGLPRIGSARIDYAARARFFSVEDGFNIKRAPLEPAAFIAERDRALDRAATGKVSKMTLRQQFHDHLVKHLPSA